jgi:hypothetical protein
MPRRSFAAHLVPPLPLLGQRLDPPPSLPEAQRRVWVDVVMGMPPGHFRPTDALLLRHLCTATAKADELALMLETNTDVARLAPLLDAHAKAVATMTSAGVKLRLWTARNRAPTKVPQPSPLERAFMEGRI